MPGLFPETVRNIVRIICENVLGALQNLLYKGTRADAFLKFQKCSAPQKKTGKNVETPQTVIVKKCRPNHLRDIS